MCVCVCVYIRVCVYMCASVYACTSCIKREDKKSHLTI